MGVLYKNNNSIKSIKIKGQYQYNEMTDSFKYVLVTRETNSMVVPQVLEDYIYSLNLFVDVIRLQDFTIEYFLKNKNTIFVITQMWLNIDDDDKLFIDYVLSTNRVIYLNVEMLSEDIRMKHVANLIKYNIQIADYSMANIVMLKQYAKHKNIQIKKDIIYLPYQYNLQDQIQLQNIDDKYEYDIGIINAKPEQSDTVDISNTYRRTIMWENLQKTKWKCLNILGWGKERDELIKRCKLIINIHHFECFNVFEHIRCDRMIFAKKIIVSDKSILGDKLDVTPYIFTEDFEDIIPRANTILENFDNYQKRMNELNMDNIILLRKKILKQQLNHICCNKA